MKKTVRFAPETRRCQKLDEDSGVDATATVLDLEPRAATRRDRRHRANEDFSCNRLCCVIPYMVRLAIRKARATSAGLSPNACAEPPTSCDPVCEHRLVSCPKRITPPLANQGECENTYGLINTSPTDRTYNIIYYLRVLELADPFNCVHAMNVGTYPTYSTNNTNRRSSARIFGHLPKLGA